MLPLAPQTPLFPYTTLFRSFNFHPHLPHYALTTDDTKSVHVLTRQPIDLDRPHPFTQAGNTEFNSLLRSEEHTSELQSHSDIVCRLLLEKKTTFNSPLDISA